MKKILFLAFLATVFVQFDLFAFEVLWNGIKSVKLKACRYQVEAVVASFFNHEIDEKTFEKKLKELYNSFFCKK